MITGEPKPLIAGMSSRDDDIKRVFFFERDDGQVIATEENEAWSLWTRKVQVLGRSKKNNYTLVGTGDGNIYRKALQEAREAGKTDITKAQSIIRKGQEDEYLACKGRIIPPKDMDKI